MKIIIYQNNPKRKENIIFKITAKFISFFCQFNNY